MSMILYAVVPAGEGVSHRDELEGELPEISQVLPLLGQAHMDPHEMYQELDDELRAIGRDMTDLRYSWLKHEVVGHIGDFTHDKHKRKWKCVYGASYSLYMVRVGVR